MSIKGYKVFEHDWTCRGFQYEVGKTYEMEGIPVICEKGFHFCKSLRDCFYYYDFDGAKIAEVTALGQIDQTVDKSGDDILNQKFCTNKIRIDREVSWEEITATESGRNYVTKTFLNLGRYNYGLDNTGNCNWGIGNTGFGNIGNRNSGDLNLGDYNSGGENIGNYNSGNCNFGDHNAGRSNFGDSNFGNFNIGSYNFGDFNSCNHSLGCFCTTLSECRTDADDEIPRKCRGNLRLFNKISEWDYLVDWRSSAAYFILRRMPTYVSRQFRRYPEAFDQEQFNKSSWEVTKTAISVMRGMTVSSKCNEPININISSLPNDEDVAIKRQEWWGRLTKRDRKIVYDLPNFDPDIFEECTLIKVDLKEYKKFKKISLSDFDKDGKDTAEKDLILFN